MWGLPLDVPGPGTLHGGELFMTDYDRHNYNADYHNIAPRFSFTHQALPRTAMPRGMGST
jgi:hypothetical protein